MEKIEDVKSFPLFPQPFFAMLCGKVEKHSLMIENKEVKSLTDNLTAVEIIQN